MPCFIIAIMKLHATIYCNCSIPAQSYRLQNLLQVCQKIVLQKTLTVFCNLTPAIQIVATKLIHEICLFFTFLFLTCLSDSLFKPHLEADRSGPWILDTLSASLEEFAWLCPWIFGIHNFLRAYHHAKSRSVGKLILCSKYISKLTPKFLFWRPDSCSTSSLPKI